MTGTKKAQIKSIEAKLLKLAQSQGRSAMEGRILFLLERAVSRMVIDSDLQRSLVFKGGFVSIYVYGSHRFTMDVDAALKGLDRGSAIQKIRSSLERDIGDACWFRFETVEETIAQGEYGGLSLKFRAGLGEPPSKIERALRIGIDLGIADPVIPGPIQTQTPFTIGDGEISWQVYPIESMIAEKLHAFLSLGDRNSRSKDIYDMNLFLDKADLKELRTAIKACFAFRGFTIPTSIIDAARKIDTAILKRGWDSATASIHPKISFEKVFAELMLKLSKL